MEFLASLSLELAWAARVWNADITFVDDIDGVERRWRVQWNNIAVLVAVVCTYTSCESD